MNPPTTPRSPEDWVEALQQAFAQQAAALELADQAIRQHPHDGQLLYLAVLAALVEEKPERALRLQKRMSKRFVLDLPDYLLQALALAQQGRWVPALELLKLHGLDSPYRASYYFLGGPALGGWVTQWLRRIGSEARRHASPSRPSAVRARGKTSTKASTKAARASKATPASKTASTPKAAPAPTPTPPPAEVQAAIVELPRLSPEIPLRLELPPLQALQSDLPSQEDPAWFRLRGEFAHLSLLQGFDELLCLPQLHQVQTFWYQVETVRKVLKVYRGRVLLADEVGLGKTIEAGMVLKEYLLRGMVEKVLILTPASLVGQWAEEMESKFDIPCATSYDPLLRSDPQAFWQQPRVIASIATARRQEHFQRLVEQHYDLVIVDEAHHLKNRSTQNYRLVDRLQKRFLLLLSATPVQNSLVELYNLLTLLKPGIFATEKDFRTAYMTPHKPRIPANRERLRLLMRDVMIRNTRALVDVRLPSRHAVTQRLDPHPEEGACYRELDARVREIHAQGAGRQRLALHHLLAAAGSSPAAAAAALHRFAQRQPKAQNWQPLAERYAAIPRGAKESALLALLTRNPEEKKMVFVHHRETLTHLQALLRAQDIPFVCFEGSLSGPDKDAAIATFREAVPVLLSTESGGEGRNVQFCNTLINFDLPWNPMAIEQRIGRVHRIGQAREVFIFNLVARGNLEDQVLHILDEKINLFELVVGEIDAILGELDETQDFAEVVFDTWVASTEQGRATAFAQLGERMVAARQRYEAVKALDDELFGEDFETA